MAGLGRDVDSASADIGNLICQWLDEIIAQNVWDFVRRADGARASGSGFLPAQTWIFIASVSYLEQLWILFAVTVESDEHGLTGFHFITVSEPEVSVQ